VTIAPAVSLAFPAATSIALFLPPPGARGRRQDEVAAQDLETMSPAVVVTPLCGPTTTTSGTVPMAKGAALTNWKVAARDPGQGLDGVCR